MSSSPFELRLQELQAQEEAPQQQTDQVGSPFEARAVEQAQEPRKSPFELRVEEQQAQSDGLWSGMMDIILSPEETPLDQGLAKAMRSVLPAIGGLPGDLASLTEGAANWIANQVTGINVGEEFKKRTGKEQARIPTSADLTEKFDALTESKYVPQNEKEEFLDELGGDIATLLIPANKPGKAFKALGVAVGSNLAKEGVKYLGAGEGSQTATKLGTMTFLSMFNPGGVKRYVNELYQKADAVLPEGASIGSKKYVAELNNLERKLKHGIRHTESTNAVVEQIKNAKDYAKKGKLEIKDITDAKIKLNDIRRQKVYDPQLRGKEVQKGLEKNFNKLSNILDNAVETYGKENPEYLKFYKDAQSGYRGIQQSKQASNFIKKTVGKHKNLILGAELAHLFYSPISAVPTGILGVGGLKSFELMKRIMDSKVLRKYYLDVIKGASQESAPTVIRNMKKLNDEMNDNSKN